MIRPILRLSGYRNCFVARPSLFLARKYTTGPQDAIQILEEDHKRIKNYMNEFYSISSVDEKHRIIEKVCKEIMLHSVVEEKHIYPLFSVYLKKKGETLSYLFTTDHKLMKELIEALSSMDKKYEMENITRTMKRIESIFDQHTKDEEQHFEVLRKVLDTKELDRLVHVFENEKKLHKKKFEEGKPNEPITPMMT